MFQIQAARLAGASARLPSGISMPQRWTVHGESRLSPQERATLDLLASHSV